MIESKEPVTMEGPVCPIPLSHDEQIVMGHGSGGKMSHDLIAKYFAASFDNPASRIVFQVWKTRDNQLNENGTGIIAVPFGR